MIIWKKLVLLSLMMVASFSAHAQSVKNIKGNRILISNEMSSLEKNAEYYIVNSSGKKTGLLRVQTLRGSQALGLLLKGQAERGATLLPRDLGEAAADPNSSSMYAARSKRESKWRFGVMAGMGQTKMAVKTSSESVDMSGMAFAFKGFFDVPLLSNFDARLSLMMLNLDAKSSEHTTSISYYGGQSTFRWLVNRRLPRYWLGGSLASMMPASKSSTAVDVSQVGTTMMYGFSAGGDLKYSNTITVPVQFDYSIFPASSEVSANHMGFYAGLGFQF